jgi:hypothetical protein
VCAVSALFEGPLPPALQREDSLTEVLAIISLVLALEGVPVLWNLPLEFHGWQFGRRDVEL